MVLEKTLECPLDSKEIQPVNPKGSNLEYSLEGPEFLPMLDVELEAPILWPPDVKSRLIGKDPDARKD